MEIQEAHKIHEDFLKRPGSKYIATTSAIAGCIYWIKKKKPKTIFEIGTGIGTLTYACLKTLSEMINSKVTTQLIVFENKNYCCVELQKNLKNFENKFHLISDMTLFPNSISEVDFIILDGGEIQEERYYQRLSKKGVIFIEGDRLPQRNFIENWLYRRGRKYVRTYFKSIPSDKRGYWIYLMEPSFSEWLFFRTRSFYKWLFFKTGSFYKWLKECISFLISRITNTRIK